MFYSLSKPTSLLEHEISTLSYLQGTKSKKTSAPLKEEEEDEDDDEGYEGVDKTSRTSKTAATSPGTTLDQNFVQSFLSGGICLRGVQHS